ncbi:ANKRD1 [Symbiodinium sp. CCMP2592]|nr:ANKRD1 [Symbiodinium sp. CCMP2592]
MAREEQRLQACRQWSKAAREVPRRNATTWSPPGTGRRHAVDAEFEIGLVKVLVFFLLDTWMNTLVLIYVAAAGEFANALCLLPSQLLVIYIQSYLALCDSELEKRRSWIKASDWRCLSFCYDALIVIVCGGVCAYTVLIIERVALEGVPEKASRTPKGGPFQSVDWMFSKRSFIWGDVGSFDCLIRFMTGAPRVVCLLHMLQWKHISFRFWLFFSTLTLTVASMIQAIVLFDFKASAFIRREYNANYWWFRVYHWSSRLLELMLRAPLLVCFARSVKRELGLPAAVAALLLDYAISAIALSVVSGASVKAFVLSLPLYLVDICRYVDEPGLVLPARQLSNFIAGQRALLLVVTAGLMFLCRERWEADDRALVTCTAAALGFRLLLRRSPASFAPLDLHEAAKQGDVQALSQLLTEGCDTSRRQCTRLRETPLHVALAHGQLSCAQLLVDDGADPHIPDAMGENPLHYACRLGDPTIAMQLLLPLPEVGEDYAVRNVAQRNADGKSPAEVLPASAPMGLRERLRDLERQELRQYTMSQLKPLVNRCDAEELATLFGLEWDRHEYSKMPADVEKGRHTGLVSFLFSRSVGDQLARVLDGLRQEQDGFHIMSLKPVRALGAGGFGSVIKVVDKRTQKFYAMKLQAKDRATKYAVREAQALHASDHAFIVGLVHIFQTSAHYCIVAWLIEEGFLDHLRGIAERGPPAPRRGGPSTRLGLNRGDHQLDWKDSEDYNGKWSSSSSSWSMWNWGKDGWKGKQPGKSKDKHAPRSSKDEPSFPTFDAMPVAGADRRDPDGRVAKNKAAANATVDLVQGTQRLINQLRKAEAKVRRNEEDREYIAEQWKLFQVKLKKTFVKERNKYLELVRKNKAEQEDNLKAQETALIELQDVLNGGVAPTVTAKEETTQEDEAAWAKLIAEEDMDDDMGLSGLLHGALDGQGELRKAARQKMLQAIAAKREALHRSKDPTTPPSRGTRVAVMSPPATDTTRRRGDTGPAVPIGPTTGSHASGPRLGIKTHLRGPVKTVKPGSLAKKLAEKRAAAMMKESEPVIDVEAEQEAEDDEDDLVATLGAICFARDFDDTVQLRDDAAGWTIGASSTARHGPLGGHDRGGTNTAGCRLVCMEDPHLSDFENPEARGEEVGPPEDDWNLLANILEAGDTNATEDNNQAPTLVPRVRGDTWPVECESAVDVGCTRHLKKGPTWERRRNRRFFDILDWLECLVDFGNQYFVEKAAMITMVARGSGMTLLLIGLLSQLMLLWRVTRSRPPGAGLIKVGLAWAAITTMPGVAAVQRRARPGMPMGVPRPTDLETWAAGMMTPREQLAQAEALWAMTRPLEHGTGQARHPTFEIPAEDPVFDFTEVDIASVHVTCWVATPYYEPEVVDLELPFPSTVARLQEAVRDSTKQLPDYAEEYLPTAPQVDNHFASFVAVPKWVRETDKVVQVVDATDIGGGVFAAYLERPVTRQHVLTTVVEGWPEGMGVFAYGHERPWRNNVVYNPIQGGLLKIMRRGHQPRWADDLQIRLGNPRRWNPQAPLPFSVAGLHTVYQSADDQVLEEIASDDERPLEIAAEEALRYEHGDVWIATPNERIEALTHRGRRVWGQIAVLDGVEQHGPNEPVIFTDLRGLGLFPQWTQLEGNAFRPLEYYDTLGMPDLEGWAVMVQGGDPQDDGVTILVKPGEVLVFHLAKEERDDGEAGSIDDNEDDSSDPDHDESSEGEDALPDSSDLEPSGEDPYDGPPRGPPPPQPVNRPRSRSPRRRHDESPECRMTIQLAPHLPAPAFDLGLLRVQLPEEAQGLERLRRPWDPTWMSPLPSGPKYKSETVEAIADMRHWSDLLSNGYDPRKAEIHIYSDGSWTEDSQLGGYAVAVVLLCAGTRALMGVWGESTHGGADPTWWADSALHNEQVAMATGLIWILQSRAFIEAARYVLHYDCRAAGMAVSGAWNLVNEMGERSRLLEMYLQEVIPAPIEALHVKAQGDPFNELVDVLSKEVEHPPDHPVGIPMLELPQKGGALPPEAGTGFALKAVSLNAQSMKGKHKFYETQLLEQHCHLAFLQETKGKAGVCESRSFLRLSTEGLSHWGVDIWINKRLGLCTYEGRPLIVTEDDIEVIFESPRLLILSVDVGGRTFVLVSGHAPHSARMDEAKVFFEDLRQSIKLLAKASLIVMGLDINGRIPLEVPGITGSRRCGEPDGIGGMMLSVARSCHLWFPSTYDELHQGPDATFHQPGGEDKMGHRIDYLVLGGVAVLTEVASQVLDSFDTLAPSVDHEAVMVDFSGVLDGPPQRSQVWKPKYDVEKILTDEGRKAVEEAVPPRWEVHPTDHYEHFRKYVHGILHDKFALNAEDKRADYISEGVWCLRQAKLGFKRSTRHRRGIWQDLADRAFLQWATGVDHAVCYLIEKHALLYELVAAAIQFATSRIKNGIRKDKANYLRNLAVTAGTAFKDVVGAAKKAGLGGRTARTPWRPMPALKDSTGATGAKKDKVWMEHFGRQECGQTVPTKELLEGGVLQECWKRSGPKESVENYRSLYISSLPAKCVHRLLRDRAGQCIDEGLHSFHMGARRQAPVLLPAMYIQAFLRWTKRVNYSVAILFVDFQSAYYKVVRELAVGDIAIESDEAVAKIFKTFGLPSEDVADLYHTIKRGGMLAEAGLPPALRHQAKDMLHRSWFITRHGGCDEVNVTSAGSRPGSSWADIIYAFVLGRLLTTLREHAAAEDLLTTLSVNIENGPWGDPRMAWM